MEEHGALAEYPHLFEKSDSMGRVPTENADPYEICWRSSRHSDGVNHSPQEIR